MRKIIGTIAFAALAAIGLPAAAQTGAAVVAKEPGKVGVAETVKATATITAIDAATRAVTLKGPQGKEMTVIAGDQVKNFAQLKVGDQVNLEYVEALTLELKKGSTAAPSRTEVAGAAAAKPGAQPGAMGGRQVTIVAEVVDVNAQTQVVTLKGPQRTVELKVKDPAQFKLVAKGDRVEATYTEAVALVVTPAKK
jgi:Cu/Ag efflux protein CusF